MHGVVRRSVRYGHVRYGKHEKKPGVGFVFEDFQINIAKKANVETEVFPFFF